MAKTSYLSAVMARLLKIFLMMACTAAVSAQDVNFSQFNVLSSYYNPAATGYFDGNYKVRMISRNQWTNLTSDPGKSFALSGDIKFDLGKNNFTKDYLALGVYFLSDKTPALNWTRNEIGVQMAFEKRLDKVKHTYLAAGAGVSVIQRSLSYENIYFQDQFDGLDQYSGSTGEILPQNIHNNGDLKLGLQLSSDLSSRWKISTGVGLHYLFQTNFSLYDNLEDINYTGSKKNDAYPRINLISNFTYQMGRSEQLFPRLHYSLQGPHQLLQVGANYRRSFYNFNQTAYHAGISLRSAASGSGFTPVDLGFLIGFEIKKIIIGMHYDAGLRDAGIYSQLTHSFEVSISLVGDYDNRSYICPEF